jgi:hypothetical protein
LFPVRLPQPLLLGVIYCDVRSSSGGNELLAVGGTGGGVILLLFSCFPALPSSPSPRFLRFPVLLPPTLRFKSALPDRSALRSANSPREEEKRICEKKYENSLSTPIPVTNPHGCVPQSISPLLHRPRTEESARGHSWLGSFSGLGRRRVGSGGGRSDWSSGPFGLWRDGSGCQEGGEGRKVRGRKRTAGPPCLAWNCRRRRERRINIRCRCNTKS